MNTDYKTQCLDHNSPAVTEGRGKNIIPDTKREPLWRGFLRKFQDPLIVVLLVVFFLSLAISFYEIEVAGKTWSTLIEPAGVLVALLLATGVGFLFEVRAEREFRMLNQRNTLLKDILRKPYLEDTLDIWDEQLVTYGALLIRKRLDYMHMLSQRAAAYHSGISRGREQLQIRYVSTSDSQPEDSLDAIREKLAAKCAQNRKNDIHLGVTLSGPHRDDIEILINGKNAKSFGSQGQQRSAVLSLKLAEAAVLHERMGEQPVILLDDVLSELDSGRQDFLLNELKDNQVFITCCEQSNKEQLREGKVFLVEKGVIHEE